MRFLSEADLASYHCRKRYFTIVFVLLLACSSVIAQRADRVRVDGGPPLKQSTVNDLIGEITANN